MAYDNVSGEWGMRLSAAIARLRLPLIVLVIFVHSRGIPTLSKCRISMAWQDFGMDDVFNLFRILISDILGAAAVPVFFFISGLLFFLSMAQWSRGMYLSKLRRRLRTLLVPFVVWNIIAVFFLLLARHNDGKAMLPYLNSHYWVGLLWDGNRGYPANVPLWYVRDLMVMCLLSPVIYWLLSRLRVLPVVTLLAVYLAGVFPPIHGLSIEALAFFTTGAYFAVSRTDVVGVFGRVGVPVAVATVLLMFADLYFRAVGAPIAVIHRGFIMGFLVSVFVAADRLPTGNGAVSRVWKRLGRMGGYVFFVYCAHTLQLVIWYDQLTEQLPLLRYPALNLAVYLTKPFVKLLICWVYYALLSRLFPALFGERERAKSSRPKTIE